MLEPFKKDESLTRDERVEWDKLQDMLEWDELIATWEFAHYLETHLKGI